MKFVAKYGILIHKRHCGVCGPNFRVLGRKYNENEDAICVETISEKSCDHRDPGGFAEQSFVNKVSDIYLTGDRTVYAGWRAVTIPQTGDGGQMNLWSTALCASFAGCVALIVWKIRRREKKSL